MQEEKINKLIKLSKNNDANATEELLTFFKSKSQVTSMSETAETFLPSTLVIDPLKDATNIFPIICFSDFPIK